MPYEEFSYSMTDEDYKDAVLDFSTRQEYIKVYNIGTEYLEFLSEYWEDKSIKGYNDGGDEDYFIKLAIVAYFNQDRMHFEHWFLKKRGVK